MERISKLENDVSEIKKDMTELKKEMTGLKEELAIANKVISELRDLLWEKQVANADQKSQKETDEKQTVESKSQ